MREKLRPANLWWLVTISIQANPARGLYYYFVDCERMDLSLLYTEGLLDSYCPGIDVVVIATDMIDIVTEAVLKNDLASHLMGRTGGMHQAKAISSTDRPDEAIIGDAHEGKWGEIYYRLKTS